MLNPSPALEVSTTDEAPDPSVLRAERRLRLLEELAEIGVELARALKPAVLAEEAKGRGPADVYGPLSRAIRLTLALEAKTDQELSDLKAGIARMREEERTDAAERVRVSAEGAGAYEHRVHTLVVEAAEAEIEDIDALDAFCEALEQRLDDDEAYYNCAHRPLRETVERLCNDLMLSPDWSRWDGEGWIHDGRARPASVLGLPPAQPHADPRRADAPAPAPRPRSAVRRQRGAVSRCVCRTQALWKYDRIVVRLTGFTPPLAVIAGLVPSIHEHRRPVWPRLAAAIPCFALNGWPGRRPAMTVLMG